MHKALSNIANSSFVQEIKKNLLFKDPGSLSNSVDLIKQYEDKQVQLLLSEKITPIYVLSDNKTIYTKNSGLVQVIRLEGKDYSGLSNQDRESLYSIRKRFFETVSHEIDLTFHYHRKKINHSIQSSANGGMDNEHAQKICQIWNEKFIGSYKTEMYLVVRISASLGSESIIESLYLGQSKDQIRLENQREEFDSQIQKILKILESYSPSVLYHSKDNKSQIVKFFSYLVNSDLVSSEQEKQEGLIVKSSKISDILALSNIEFDKNSSIVTFSRNGINKYCQILSISSYPEDKTDDKIFEALLRSKHQFNVVQQVIPVNREISKLSISRQIKDLRSMVDFSFIGKRMEDLKEIGESIEAGDLELHDYVVHIHVYADTKKELRKSVIDIQGILNQSGISLIAESFSIELGYWSMLPDYEKINSGRKVPLSTGNISNFITLGSSLEGLRTSPFGNSPITTFKTIQNTSYNFNFHKSADREALGHTLVIGAPESGKTTLISFLLMNCLKYKDLKILAFDSYNGLKIPTTSFGGDYIDTSRQRKLNLNPFLLPDNTRNREFLKTFISILTKGIKSNDEQNLINEVVKQNYQLKDKGHRNLGIVKTICGIASSDKDNKENITARMEQWLPDEENPEGSRYSDIFNSKKDSLSFDKRIVAFDMIDVLKKSDVLSPLSSYIFYCFDEFIRNNPVPHICFIDEMATYLQDETFSNFINKASQEWRKRKGIIIGAIQSPKALIESTHGKKIISNLATYIIFPDSTAEEKDYIDALGLNDSEFDWVRAPNPDRQVMVKRRGGESVILDVDLSSLGEYLKLFSSGHEYVSKMLKIEQEMLSSKKSTGSTQKELNLVEEYLRRIK